MEISSEDSEIKEHMFKLLKSFREEVPRDEAGKISLNHVKKSLKEC